MAINANEYTQLIHAHAVLYGHDRATTLLNAAVMSFYRVNRTAKSLYGLNDEMCRLADTWIKLCRRIEYFIARSDSESERENLRIVLDGIKKQHRVEFELLGETVNYLTTVELRLIDGINVAMAE